MRTDRKGVGLRGWRDRDGGKDDQRGDAGAPPGPEQEAAGGAGAADRDHAGRFQLPTSSTSRRGGYSFGFDLHLDPIRLDHVGALSRLSTEERDFEDSQQTIDLTGKDVGNCKCWTCAAPT